MPSEFFYLNAVDDTLTLSTRVIEAEPSAPTSTIIRDGDWLELCNDSQSPNATRRIPFIVNDIHIQIRDA